MKYRDQLSPWCIIRHLPKMQRVVVARFRKRNDAESHLKVLQRLNSTIGYELVFDPPDESSTDAFEIDALEPTEEPTELSLKCDRLPPC